MALEGEGKRIVSLLTSGKEVKRSKKAHKRKDYNVPIIKGRRSIRRRNIVSPNDTQTTQAYRYRNPDAINKSTATSFPEKTKRF